MTPFRILPEEDTGWVRTEITQRNQFDSDEHGLAETFVREFLQNAVDARVDNINGGADVRFDLRMLTGDDAAYLHGIVKPLDPHLKASGIELPAGESINLLVAEDFGTTGLRGNYLEYVEKENYSAFFHSHGLTSKGGKSNGRWGLGKTTYSSASRIRTFLALTVRSDDTEKTPLVMGQSVLSIHRLPDGKYYKPHVFIAGPDAGYPLPVQERKHVQELARVVGFARTDEPGLSVAIPFAKEDITKHTLIVEVLRNYYFPILTGRLVVRVCGVELSADTFDAVMKEYAVDELGADFAAFVRAVNAARGDKADATMGNQWRTDVQGAIPKEQTEKLREIYASGKLVSIDAPIVLRRKTGETINTSVRLFLRKAPEGAAGRALFVRGDITVPGMAANFPVRSANAALVAGEDTIVEFLGDSENPAHTHWDGRAEKLQTNWKAGADRIREIKTVLRRVHACLDQSVDASFPDALKDIFKVKAPGDTGRMREKREVIKKKKIEINNRSPRLFRIVRRAGGFAVKATPDLTADKLPMQIKIRVAYDVSRGNPFKKHEPFDFDLTSGGDVGITHAEGAKTKVLTSNRFAIDVENPVFDVDVTGFDARRDLIVDAER
ncbi:MAG TPA: hypothetical protein VIM56_11285 [Rhizomicrobium sp.]